MNLFIPMHKRQGVTYDTAERDLKSLMELKINPVNCWVNLRTSRTLAFRFGGTMAGRWTKVLDVVDAIIKRKGDRRLLRRPPTCAEFGK